MKIEQYSIKNFMDMDPMHDSYAIKIKLGNKCLIVVYDKLDEGVLAPDGQPYYKNKKLTIKYEFDSQCEARIYYNKNKYLFLDLIDNMNKFIKITKNCMFQSFRFLVDSFGELTLDFSIIKIIKDKYINYKYWGLEIKLDAVKVTYIWE